MNLNDLETFLSVARLGTLSQAAEHLHITQPAVTKRIQNLEQSLDCALFSRVGRRLLLTSAGEALLPNAELISGTVANTHRQMQQLTNAAGGELRIATSHHIGLHRLAPVLREFRRSHPQVQLNLRFEDSEVAYQMVRNGSVELAVVTLNPAGDPELTEATVWDDPLVFVDSEPGHSNMSLQALAERPCVLPGPNTYTGRIVGQRFAEHNLPLNPAMSTNYLETIGMLVSVGLGWSVLPATMVVHLHILDVACAAMGRRLGYVFDPRINQSSATQRFIETLDQARRPSIPFRTFPGGPPSK